MLELGAWIAQHYCCPLGRTLTAMVPEAVRRQSGFLRVRYAQLRMPLEQITESAPRLGGKQRALLQALGARASPAPVGELLTESGASAATLAGLAKRGWVKVATRREPPASPTINVPLSEPDFVLTDEQAAAIKRVSAMLDAQRFRVGLLFGVSGSGKTEVYVRAIRRALEHGGQSILLVPEIALTTQLVMRLAARFGSVAVIHSGLTGVQRSLTWADIAAGRRAVIIGTRSAVFAPCPQLKLIVVDEEQEASYKNLAAPRFNVRDVAIKRAQVEGIPILLGSATPSLETWFNCQRAEHFERLELPRRVRNLPMPRVHIVDVRDFPQTPAGPPVLSPLLEKRLAETLARGEQAMLLMNRRGYARVIWCPRCKRPVRCPNCQVSMVYHAPRARALCHYCHHSFDAPKLCPDPSCQTPLVTLGAGTQRVEELLQRRFPRARLVRVDSDTMTRAAHYQQVVDDFEARRIDLMVGTQMIAKGLDFPFVSLVGVLSAENVGSVDFRAQERLFQLITQVAGRAGRNELPGEVVVQTALPEALALLAAVRHDYPAFVEGELAIRRLVRYPPYARLTRLILSDPRPAQLESEAQTLAANIRETIQAIGEPHVDLLGPHLCVLERLRKQYRYELLIRADSAVNMQRVLDRLRGEKRLRAKVKSLVVDVDPVDLS
jgi:primosomal protein N' (replication factor Y)